MPSDFYYSMYTLISLHGGGDTMASIAIALDGVQAQSLRMGKCVQRVSGTSSSVRAVHGRVDRKILNRRSLESRLNRARRNVQDLENASNEFTRFLEQSLSSYIDVDKRVLNDLLRLTGDLAKSSDEENRVINIPLPDPIPGHVIEVGKNVKPVQSEGFLSKIVSKIKPKNDWKSIGKAVLGTGMAVFGVALAASAFVAGGGFIAGVALAYAASEVIASSIDLYHTYNGNDELVGVNNPLENFSAYAFGQVGRAFGNEELGEKVGRGAYHAVGFALFAAEIPSAVKSLGRLPKTVSRVAKGFKSGATSVSAFATKAIKNVKKCGSFKQLPKMCKNASKVIKGSFVSKGKKVLSTSSKAISSLKTTMKSINAKSVGKVIDKASDGLSTIKGVLTKKRSITGCLSKMEDIGKGLKSVGNAYSIKAQDAARTALKGIASFKDLEVVKDFEPLKNIHEIHGKIEQVYDYLKPKEPVIDIRAKYYLEGGATYA